MVVDEAQPQRRGQVGLLCGDEPQSERDRDRHAELRARPQPERATLDELGVVVGEAEQGTGQRSPEDSYGAPFVIGEDQKRDTDSQEQDDAAHRRRARLVMVPLGSVLVRRFPTLS